MKVEKISVHRLTVSRECGCAATREYKDPQYKEPIDEATYEPCKKHKAKPDLVEMMGMILKEDVEQQAAVNAAPQYAPLRVPNAEPTTLDGSVTSEGGSVTSTPINRPRARVQVAPAGTSGGGGQVPAPQAGPRRDPTQVRTVQRDHGGVGRRGAISGRAPVTGVTASSPAAGRTQRREVVQVGDIELATPGFDDIDITEDVPEDPRVTRLAEAALLPDLEDDPSQA